MKKSLFVLLFLSLITATTQAQDWKAKTGSVTFSLKMLGVTVDGKLSGIKANLKFENDEPTYLYATIESNTVFTDNSLRDSHLKEKPEFFQPEKYPQVKMRSKSITKTADGYEAVFDITLKDKTKSQKVPFIFTNNGDSGKLAATFVMDRTDWDFGGNTFGMGDDVTVKIALNISK